MTNLLTLWGLNMENDSLCFLREMPKLSSSLKKLKVVVSREEELKAAFCCPSLVADVLHTFHCDVRDSLAFCNVEPLHTRQHLLKLTLIGQIQMRLALLLPINLVRLELRDSMIEDASPMEALGALAHLKRLSLSNAYAGAKLSYMAGSFPQLNELNVESLRILTTWTIEKGALPCLKKLEISRCWRLENFPEGLPLVTTLEQLEFFDMPNAFNRQATKYGWAPLKLTLPHNLASIIKRSDSPVDSSSIHKLCEQLISGIFLDNKTMKYWVTEKDGCCINSFIVYVQDLCVCSGYFLEVGIRDQLRWEVMEDCPYVEMKEVIESLEDGTMVTVAKIKSLMSSGYTQVIGKFDLLNLSLEVNYEIDWIIMFEEPEHSENSERLLKERGSFVDEVKHATRIKTQLNGRVMHAEVTFGNYVKRLNEWISIPGGEFYAHPATEGQFEPSFSYEKGMNTLDLVIKGFIIRPKL